MTSALQRAHDTAKDEQGSEPVICTVAGPRIPFSAAVYTGAELRPTSMRMGAYDAMALPSIFNGRRVAPTEPRLEAIESSTPAPPVRRPKFVHTSGHVQALHPVSEAQRFSVLPPSEPMRRQGLSRELTPTRIGKGGYLPKPGSIPSLLLAHLTEHGGHLPYSEITRRFGLPKSSVTAVFKKALVSQVLVRLVIDQRASLALPGYVPPPDAPKPSKDLLARQSLLEKRRAQVAQLEREVADLREPAEPTLPITR